MQIGGCRPPPGDTGDNNTDEVSTETEQGAEADLTKASTAADTLTEALDAGTSTSEALAALGANLSQDPAVTSVMLGEEGETVWALYASGLEHVFAVLDGDAEDTPPADAPVQETAQRIVPPLRESSGKLSAAQTVPVSNLNSKVPARSKAVVANSLTVAFPSQDTTGVAEKILKGCGYQVTRVAADLELFKQLSQFGVIYIEAHGWPSPIITPESGPLCRSAGGTMVVQTTTPATFRLNGVDLPTKFCSVDGQTVVIDASAEVQMSYTLTKTDLQTSAVETSNGTLAGGLKTQASVGADLSILAGSYTDGNCTIRWPKVAPKPAFDADTEPC